MTKRCRRCGYYRWMKQLMEAWPDIKEVQSWGGTEACLNCRRFPKIRKSHPDNFTTGTIRIDWSGCGPGEKMGEGLLKTGVMKELFKDKEA